MLEAMANEHIDEKVESLITEIRTQLMTMPERRTCLAVYKLEEYHDWLIRIATR